jgi:hypothetical protein
MRSNPLVKLLVLSNSYLFATVNKFLVFEITSPIKVYYNVLYVLPEQGEQFFLIFLRHYQQVIRNMLWHVGPLLGNYHETNS